MVSDVLCLMFLKEHIFVSNKDIAGERKPSFLQLICCYNSALFHYLIVLIACLLICCLFVYTCLQLF